MVHELKSEPFYKPNVLAMLNTLFPPNMKDLPNERIDVKALQKYRTTFYQYIQTVDAKGTIVMKDFIQQLLKPEAKHSWISARYHLEKYIEMASLMIQRAKALGGIDAVEENDSPRHSRTVSGANSALSERPSTASSANTSLDTNMQSLPEPKSPEISVTSNQKAKLPRSARVSNSADGAITFQPLSPSLAPRPLQAVALNATKNSPSSIQDQKTPSTSSSVDRRSVISRPPTRPIPPLPRIKTSISTSASNLASKSPAVRASPQQLSASSEHSDASRPKSHSIPPPKPLTSPRVLSNAQKQTLAKSPLSSAFVAEEVALPVKVEASVAKPSTPPVTIEEAKSSQLDFLNHPYTDPSLPEPILKKKSSKSNLFQRRKGSDASTLKTSGSGISLNPFKSPKIPEGFTHHPETEAHTLGGLLRRKKSQPSLPKDEPQKSSSETVRSATWTKEKEPEATQNSPALLKSQTWAERSSSEAETIRPTLRKNKSATALFSSIGRARGALRSRKPSPKKAEFPVEDLIIQPYTTSLEFPAPEPALHPPSAPSSPVMEMFASQVIPPRESNLRRTKSHDDHKKPHRVKFARKLEILTIGPIPTDGFHSPDAKQPSRDYRGIPLDRIIKSTDLVEPLPSTYMQRELSLPLDEKYNETRAREQTRKALIEKARAMKIDAEFESPRTPPVPQTARSHRGNFEETGWVPFEMPRATPKRPERKTDVSPQKQKVAPVNVSRFSLD